MKQEAEIARLRADRVGDQQQLFHYENEIVSLHAEVERLTGLLRDWLLAHGHDRNDLRDEVAILTRAALAADGKG